MIKNRIKLYLTFCISFLLSINSIYAYSVGDVKSHTSSADKTQIKDAFKWPTKAGPIWNNNYVGMDHKLSGADAYCIDGLRISSGKCSGEYKIINTNDVLDPNDKADYVLLYMLSEGNYSYNARTVAIRAFLPFTDHLSNNQTLKITGDNHGNRVQVFATYNSGAIWASNNSNIKKVLGISSNSLSSLKSYAKSKSGYNYDQTIKKVCNYINWKNYNCSTTSKTGYSKLYNDVASPDTTRQLKEDKADIASAKKLFNEAINKAATYSVSDEKSKLQIKFNKDIAFDNNYSEEYTSGGVQGYKRRINFSLKVTGGNTATSPITINVNPDSNGYVKLDSMEYSLDGLTNWTKFTSSTDLRSLFDKDNAVLFVRTTVFAPYLQGKESISLNFTTSASYTIDGVLAGAIFSRSNNASYCQRMIIGGGGSSPATVKDSANLVWEDRKAYCQNHIPNKSNTDEFKTYLKTCCKPGNKTEFSISNECNKALVNANTIEEKNKIMQENAWCQKEIEYCSVCDGTVSVPATCSEFGDGETPKCEDNADAIIKDNDNIKLCVLDYSDEANNDYKMTTDQNVASNDYCNVYCKEDFKVSLPLGRWVSAGRSFTLSMSMNDTKSCYTDLINYDKFIKDLNEQKSLLDANSNNLTARARYKSIVNQYKTCAEASWDNTIKFEPEVSLTYDEKEYLEKFTDNKVKFVVGNKVNNEKKSETTLSVSNDNIWLCNGNDVDDYYNICSGGTATNKVEDQTSQTLTNYYDPETFTKTNLVIPLTKYAKKISMASAVYVPESNLYTKVGSGVVVQQSIDLDTYNKLSTNIIVDGEEIEDAGKLPIALKRSTGALSFNILFNGIGEYFDSGRTGRLVGGTNSVALQNGNTTFKGEYICSYVVNCPECTVACKEDPDNDIFCSIGDKPSTPTCITCKPDPVQYSDGQLFNTRQISLTNINPSERQLGLNLSTLKGKTAKEAIEAAGENIYSDKDSKSKLEYSITLTPSETRMLQQYNDKKVSSGGYSSLDDFTCKPYSSIITDKDGQNKELYEELKKHDYTVCVSKLLNGSLNDYKLKNILNSSDGNRSWLEACNGKNNSICTIGGFYGPAFK